jgi:hypothetical protein
MRGDIVNLAARPRADDSAGRALPTITVGRALARAGKSWPLVLTLLSLLATVLIPWQAGSENGDLSGFYTDHIHHPFATWVALTKGLGAVYATPFAEAWQGSTWPHPVRVWPSVPAMAYPPGVLVLYLPMSLVGRFIPMQAQTFAALSMTYVLATAHLALYWVFKLLDGQSRGGRFLVAFLLWIQFLEFGLEGFHDALVFGFAALSLIAARDRRFGLAFVAIGLGISLHYRAGAPFAPIVIYCLVEFARSRRSASGWGGVAALVLLGIICTLPLLWSFRLMNGELQHLELVCSSSRLRLFVLTVSLAYVLLLLRSRQWPSAFAALAAAALVVTERCPFFWHGAILLSAPMLVGATSKLPPRSATLLRGVGCLMFVGLRPLVWHDSADFIWRRFANVFLGV